MFKPPCKEAMLKHAMAAARRNGLSVCQRTYAGGVRTVVRGPNGFTRRFFYLRSWDFARVAGVTLATARKRLAALSDMGLLILEQPGRKGAVLTYRLRDEDSDCICRELIAELRAQGLPWNDEWLAEQAAKRGVRAAA